MKRLFIILFLVGTFFVCSAPSFLNMQKAAISRRNTGSVECALDNDSAIWTPTGETNDLRGHSTWSAIKITLAAETTVTSYHVVVCDDSGSDTGSETIVVMDHDSGNDQPDETSVVVGSSVNMLASNFADCGDGTQRNFDLASTYVLSAGTYWIVQEEIDGAALAFAYDNSSSGDRSCYSTNDGSTWTCTDDIAYNVELWGCQ